MICNNCGKQLKDGAAFCSGCGASLGAGQAPPPPQYQQQYPQAPPPQYQHQYQQAPPPGAKKPLPKKPLFGIAGAAAAVLVFFFVIFPMIGGSGTDSDGGGISIDIVIEPPEGRGTGFEPTDGGFGTNDQSIAMIEVNQGLSYGFDTETGEFYLMDNFVAGKETGIFVSLTEPPDPASEIMMTIEREGEIVATLFPELTDDPQLLLFQPKNMSDVNNWEKGVYTFTVTIDDKYAYRETNFFQSMPVKILAFPVITNYAGKIISCTGDWKNSASFLFATYPISHEEFEYVLGPELDLSHPRYDITTDNGMYNVWDAIKRCQTPDKDYTLIIGFIPEQIPIPDGSGYYLGYTCGFPGNVVVENYPGIRATVPHEIAHCYKIGDEYHGGALNDILNSPPYMMEGWDILTGRGGAVGTKEKVVGGEDRGLVECGSLLYDEQRPYWAEEKRLLTGGLYTSFMGWASGADENAFWITSDIWNHLFKAFTGQLNGNEPGYASPGGGEYYGQCYECYGDVYDPVPFVQCRSCYDYVVLYSNNMDCSCGAKIKANEYNDDEFYYECPLCWEFLNQEKFDSFNSPDDDEETARVKTSETDLTMALNITGYFESDGAFFADPWFSYPAPKRTLTANKEGEYSAIVYNSKGDVISKTFFDVVNKSEVTRVQDITSIADARIPIDILVSFPEGSFKVVILKGDKEVYSKTVSANVPKAAFTGLSEGQKLSDNMTLTWEGSDSDGDELTYEIWYYQSGDELYLVAAGLTEKSFDADLTSYPGTNSGWFRIYATDGVLTAAIDSPKISLPFKAPDILNDIPDGTKFKVTDMVEIQGKVFDAQDGWLTDEGYEWSIDGKPFNTDGTFYFYHHPYMFTPGNHTVTMKVTNSGGVSASKDFRIEILEDESDIPKDWPKNDVTLALRMGFYQPLDWLDSPITRIEYAKMMFGLYAKLLPENRPSGWKIPMADIVCEFSDMSNDKNDLDYIYASCMVAMGLIEPKNMSSEVNGGVTTISGEFDPHGSMTQREAMQIMYMAIELSKSLNYTAYKTMDESEFIPLLTEWGVFGGESFNAYNAGEKMSKGLTMVRIARFLRFALDMEDKDYGIASGYYDDDGEMARGGGNSFTYNDDLSSASRSDNDDLIRNSLF